jgi:hypothetical protein
MINVPGGRQFTDPEIKEFLNRAVGWAQQKLRSSPVKDLRQEVDLTLVTPAKSFTVGVLNELPTNFIIPIRLWEKQEGKWKEMTQARDHLPINAEPKEQLLWWAWQGGKLLFTGANQNVEVRIHYRGSIPELTIPLDTIPVNGLDEAVIAKAIAIGSVLGKLDQAQYWEGSATELLDRFIQVNIKPYQATGFRRKRRRISLPPWRY